MSRLASTSQRETTTVKPALTVSVATLVWVAATAIFLALRLGNMLQAPVAGAELVHLSGAWQAREGIADERFVPTLFQALSAAILFLTSSEIGPRILAFFATATIPLAVFTLRSELGRAGALLTLIFLAFDGLALNLGVSASAMGLDLAITAWLLVAAMRPATPPWAWALLGFLVVTAGPLPLALVVAMALTRLLERRRLARGPRLYAAAVGVAAGVIATSAGFGFDFDGIVIAPVELLIAGFDETWSTATTFEAILLYGSPYLLAGATAIAFHGLHVRRTGRTDTFTLLLLLWTGVSLVWFLASAGSRSTTPIVALTMPLSLLLGPAAARALSAMAYADWRISGPVLGAAALVLAIAVYAMLDWGRLDRTGPTAEVLLVSGMFGLVAVALIGLAASPRTAPSLAAAALFVAAFPVVSGAFGIAFPGYGEPIYSPFQSRQVPQIRFTARELAGSTGGSVVVHPSLASDVTWPLRNIDVVTASEPGADTAFVLWPSGQPAPEGMLPLGGSWALVSRVESPVSSPLKYLRWLTNPNVLAVSHDPVDVYSRPTE